MEIKYYEELTIAIATFYKLHFVVKKIKTTNSVKCKETIRGINHAV
jgi:hypothetical protein